MGSLLIFLLMFGISVASYSSVDVLMREKSTSSPGVKLTLSQAALNYAASVATELLSAEVQGKSIPDQHGSDHVAVGKVKYDITGMRVKSFTKPSAAISIQTGKGLALSVNNAGVSVHGNWHYEYKVTFVKIKDSGSFDVTVSGASLNAGIAMGKSSDGHPTISSTSCSSHVNDISVKFHGGASWLYNLFRHNVEKPIRNAIQDMLCKSVKKGIDTDANKALARMKVRVPIKKSPIIVDYRLVTAPVFGKGFITSNHKGEFFFGSDQSEAPFAPQVMAQPETTQKMVTICLADYVINTLGYVLNKYAFLKYTMTAKDLSPKDRGFLNTTCVGPKCIGGIVAQLGKKFPNSSVEIFMRTTSAPSLHASPNDVTGRFNGTVTFNVRLPNGTVTLGFSTHTVANVSLTGQIALNDSNRITAKVNNIHFHMKVTKSNVGSISDIYLNSIFGFAVKLFVIPKMDEVGKEGFVLPSIDVVQFVHPQIYILQNTLCFGTDAKYVPHTL